MIISASRRTDIPAHYADWFFRRLQEESVCVRNPMNIHQVSRISLSKDVVDGIVFWTKNPIPMLHRLDRLDPYPFYVHFTLNAYSSDLEPGLPDKASVLLPAFQRLSRQIGASRVIWRYDPIILTQKYSISYHLQAFSALARALSGYTETCVISFVDAYRHLQRISRALGFLPLEERAQRELASGIAEICRHCGIKPVTCAEAIDLSAYGIEHSHCIDAQLLQRISGNPLEVAQDPNQRPACGCASSIDIGMYDSCANGCRYCYANHSPETVRKNLAAHDPHSPLLYGALLPTDHITDRKMVSNQVQQLTWF